MACSSRQKMNICRCCVHGTWQKPAAKRHCCSFNARADMNFAERRNLPAAMPVVATRRHRRRGRPRPPRWLRVKCDLRSSLREKAEVRHRIRRRVIHAILFVYGVIRAAEQNRRRRNDVGFRWRRFLAAEISSRCSARRKDGEGNCRHSQKRFHEVYPRPVVHMCILRGTAIKHDALQRWLIVSHAGAWPSDMCSLSPIGR